MMGENIILGTKIINFDLGNKEYLNIKQKLQEVCEKVKAEGSAKHLNTDDLTVSIEYQMGAVTRKVPYIPESLSCQMTLTFREKETPPSKKKEKKIQKVGAIPKEGWMCQMRTNPSFDMTMTLDFRDFFT